MPIAPQIAHPVPETRCQPGRIGRVAFGPGGCDPDRRLAKLARTEHVVVDPALNSRSGPRPLHDLGLHSGCVRRELYRTAEVEDTLRKALARIPENRPCKVLDLGTGSGAIAISIARNRPQAAVTAVDRSAQALAVARDNAARLGAPNLRLLESNWFGALEEEIFDLIVSNPPYVEATDPHLQQGDVRFEPLSALASGADGLDDIRRIAAASPSHLKPGGWLLFEHGWNQGEGCREILRQQGFSEVATARDLAGQERVSMGSRAT